MFRLLLLFLLLVPITLAGTSSLVWEDTSNPTGTTYSVYRASGTCSAATLFSKIATNVVEKRYEDLNLVPGIYCYKVTATFNNLESGFSNTAENLIPLAAPTALSVTVK